MEEENIEQATQVTVRLLGKEEAEPICNMIRGLLLSSRSVELKGVTNSRLLRGHTVSFDAADVAQKFVTDVETLFSRRVRERLEITVQD